MVLFSTCTRENDDTASQEFGSNIPAALANGLRQMGASIQQKEIDPAVDSKMIGKKGTVIFIPANSLVDEAGNPVTSKVNVQLKENYSIANMVSSNLQTIHNGDILQTQGMIYLTATTANGKAVKIDASKPIRIEFLVTQKIGDVKIFKGKRVKDSTINWEQPEEPSKLLVPFPIKALALAFGGGECSIIQITDLFDTAVTSMTTYSKLHEYENTLVATREFCERYYRFCRPELAKFYLDHRDKNMCEIDELMVQYLIEDSTKQVRDWKSKVTPTKEQKQLYEQILGDHAKYLHDQIQAFRKFAAQKLTKIDTLRKVSDNALAAAGRIFDSTMAEAQRRTQ